VLLLVIEGMQIDYEHEHEHEVRASMESAIDCSGKVYFPVTRTIKASLLFSIFALCALGAIFSPKEKREDREQSTQVVPVNNHKPSRGVWLRA
jgi:hypothetical protein